MLESLADMLHREPFQSFRIVLTRGDRYEVSNPDWVALGQTQATIYAPTSDRFSIVRLNQVAALEAVSPAA